MIAVQGEKGAQFLVVPELADYLITSLEKVVFTFWYTVFLKITASFVLHIKAENIFLSHLYVIVINRTAVISLNSALFHCINNMLVIFNTMSPGSVFWAKSERLLGGWENAKKSVFVM